MGAPVPISAVAATTSGGVSLRRRANSADSVPATIYEVTVQKALSQTFTDDLGPELFQEYLGGSGSSVLRTFELLIDKPDDPFWDNTSTSTHENRDAILGLALNDALGINHLLPMVDGECNRRMPYSQRVFLDGFDDVNRFDPSLVEVREVDVCVGPRYSLRS